LRKNHRAAIKEVLTVGWCGTPDFICRIPNRLPLAEGMRAALLVQNDGQQGLIDLDFPVVFDEAQLSEFVHEEIYA
jgi:hypothetical protein